MLVDRRGLSHGPSLAASRSSPNLLETVANGQTWNRSVMPTRIWNEAGPYEDLSLLSSYHTSIVPTQAARTFSVWPPPPLPPVSRDLALRVEALEINKTASAGATVVELQLELVKCNAEWESKFGVLEGRWRKDEADAAGRIAQAEEETVRLRRELQGLRNAPACENCPGLQQQLDTVEDRHKATIKDVIHLKKANSTREETIRDLRVQLADLREECDQLQYDVANARSANSESSGQQLASITSERDQLRLDLQHMRNANSAREATVQELRMSRDEIAAERDQHQRDIAHLKKANSEREATVKTLRGQLVDFGAERDQLLADAQHLKNANEMLRQAESKLREDVRSVRQDMSSQRKTVFDLQQPDASFKTVNTQSSTQSRTVYDLEEIENGDKRQSEIWDSSGGGAFKSLRGGATRPSTSAFKSFALPSGGGFGLGGGFGQQPRGTTITVDITDDLEVIRE